MTTMFREQVKETMAKFGYRPEQGDDGFFYFFKDIADGEGWIAITAASEDRKQWIKDPQTDEKMLVQVYDACVYGALTFEAEFTLLEFLTNNHNIYRGTFPRVEKEEDNG